MQTKKKTNNERLKQLTNEILELDRLYNHSPSADLIKSRMTLQTEFDNLSTRQAEYLISKVRHGHYEHGEKAGRVLAHHLRQKSAKQTIPAIYDDQGIKCTDNKEINSCFSKFYQLLYTPDLTTDPSKVEDFFKALNIPSVKSELVTELEVISAIRDMQSGKSPVPDHFPTEFFKTFENQLSPLLPSVFEESLLSRSLPPSLHKAVISLLLKKD